MDGDTEDRGEQGQGRKSSEKSELNGLVDKEIVGMVRFKRTEPEVVWWAFKKICVPE